METDATILEFLNEHYPTSTCLRALLGWAGRAPGHLPPDTKVAELWSSIWQELPLDAQEGASRVRLLREALFDRPGDSQLLEVCSALAGVEYPATQAGASGLLQLLEAASAPSPLALRERLTALPEARWAPVFLSIVPAFDDWLPQGRREELAAASLLLTQLPAYLADLEKLIIDSEREPESAELAARLGDLHAFFDGLPIPEIEHVASALGSALAVAEEQPEEIFPRLCRLEDSVEAAPWEAAVGPAQALYDALEATFPEEEEGEDDEPEARQDEESDEGYEEIAPGLEARFEEHKDPRSGRDAGLDQCP